MIPERPSMEQAEAVRHVALLPPRVAHVTAALQMTCDERGGGPVRPKEIILYDWEALTVKTTCAALHRAMHRYALVDRWGRGLYVPTVLAGDLKDALEARYLVDSDQSSGSGEGS